MSITIKSTGGMRAVERNTVGIVPWAGISKQAEAREYANGYELAKALDLDWRAEPGRIMRVGNPGHTREGFQYPEAITNFRGVFHSRTGDCLGTVGRNWHAIQNTQLCDLAVATSRIMPITITGGGILGVGEKVWVMADLGTRTIANRVLRNGEQDALNQYVLFLTHHNGLGAARIIPCPNELYCANALNGLVRTRGNYGWTIRHTLHADKRLEQAKRGIFEATRCFDELVAEMEDLNSKPFTEREMVIFADQLINETRGLIDATAAQLAQRSPAQVEQQEGDKATLVRLFSEGASNIGETKLDALKAVTEFISHHRRRAQRAGDATRAALTRLENDWFGTRETGMRRRALNILQHR